MVKERRSISYTIFFLIHLPYFIHTWTDFTELPFIPVFNITNYLFVLFVNNIILVDTLADTIISGLEDEKHLCNTVLHRNDETRK